jgi:hypothetical protein
VVRPRLISSSGIHRRDLGDRSSIVGDGHYQDDVVIVAFATGRGIPSFRKFSSVAWGSL